jgi:hypothetical protein
MLFNFTRSTLTSQPSMFVFDEQLFDDVLPERRNDGMIGKGDFILHDVVKRFISSRTFEGSDSIQHLIDEYPASPKVQ